VGKMGQSHLVLPFFSCYNRKSIINREGLLMGRNFIEIEDVPKGYENRVRQNLDFKTGNFIWRCRFSTALDPSTITADNLYVESETGTRIKTRFTYNDADMEIEVEPLEAYAKETDYFLHITTRVKSRGGQNLKEPVEVKFRL
jgi:N-acetylmuramoyl-L-alanine amidase